MSDQPNQPPTSAPAETGQRPAQRSHQSAWSPLAIAVFRWLWIATIVSNIGTWAQEAGGPWLMKLLRNDPKWVAFVAVAENLPICLLSVVAGALADLLDRRKLLIFTQIWMLVASGLLGVITLEGWTTPGLLLAFTALLGVGIALSGPAFQAIVPELVPPGDMPLAVALNSVALNVARAIGPALGMVVVIAAGSGTRGPGASFLLNAASFVGVAFVLYKWNRPTQGGHAHAEQLWDAVKLGFRYTQYSPAMLAILIRVAAFILCAVAMWAELPVIAQDQLGLGAGGYGALMGCLGSGAVVGVIFMPRLQRKLSIDGMVAACTGMFALGLMALALVRIPVLGYLIMLFIGFNWVVVPTNFNVATQRSVPNWVKGRALSMYLTTLFGSWAVGSAVWGAVAKHTSISTALLLAGALMVVGLAVFRRFRLTINSGHDFSPAFAATHLPPNPPTPDPSGAVLATVQWALGSDTVAKKHTLQELRRQRLRNGARSWDLRPGGASPDQWVETFSFRSQAEYAQHHVRTTKADFALQEQLRTGVHPPAPPHLRRREPSPAAVWIANRAYDCIERALDEMEIAYRRIVSKT